MSTIQSVIRATTTTTTSSRRTTSYRRGSHLIVRAKGNSFIHSLRVNYCNMMYIYEYIHTYNGVISVVIKGLADHKDSLEAPLCSCRHYDDKAAEANQGFWNCPCVPMRERKECHCMPFLTPDNDFAGQEQIDRNNDYNSRCCWSCNYNYSINVVEEDNIVSSHRTCQSKECHCMLILTPDKDFAGQEQIILINYN
ncbi:hypothetical protein GIB67_022252 [Kingdonia uniflora]|uniref:Ferredoxin-thioredoxin reductase catalytic chain, chloroplastic n=1 Tax=Kingdonia uniflora TaxID=39325 RepID=A0A7J7M754_9MAGN|nr:hypothetical protein GIB67_022252 [Kingdonia uniflora]